MTDIAKSIRSLTQSVAQLNLRNKVWAAEECMKATPSIPKNPEEVCPHKDYFSQGVYAREMFIPKGTVIIGKLHKHQQLNVLLSGDLSVVTESGVQRIRPPFVVVSPPGTKRMAYAHEDSVWLTVHGTELTDVDEIERTFVAQTEEEYLAFEQALRQQQLEKTE